MFMLKQSTFVVMMAAASLCAADVPAPANPEVTGYQRRGFRYELKVDVPLVDVDGNHIDKENLSYRLYVDGKPFTFTTAEYGYIEADMAEIPWDYQDANGVGNDIMKWVGGDNCRRIFLYSQASTIGVESVHRIPEGEAVSARYVYDTVSGEGYVESSGNPTGEDVIVSLPENAVSRLYTLDTWLMAGIMLQRYTWSGRFDYLGFDGDDVYIKDICGYYRFGTYVKGTVMDDGATLRIPMKQHVFHQEENQDEGLEAADVYLQAIRIDETGDDLELLPELEYVDFTIDAHGVIRLADGMGVAYVGHDGHLLAKNIGYEYRPFDMERSIVTPPAGMESEPYNLAYCSEPGGNRSSRSGLKVVLDKENGVVYVQGLAKTMPGWVKGSIEGDKVVFPSAQYVGTYVNDMKDEFAVYLNGAYDSGEYDLFGRVYATQDNLTFTLDSRLGTMKSEDCVTETIGSVNPLSSMVSPELTPAGLKPFEPAVPANPSIVSFGRRGFIWELYADIPSMDADGHPMDIDGLVYRFYLNGSDEPFVFSADVYEYIEGDMTDIPWGYQDKEGIGYDIMKWPDGNSRRIFFYEEPTTIGLEASYTCKGETRTSLRHVWNADTGQSGYVDPAGVSAMAGDGAVVGVAYTDMTGLEVSAPSRGIYVKTTRYADGTVKNERICFR